MRKLSPEQLIRNMKAATEQGNFSKARELLTLAAARGSTGSIPEAYESFLDYTEEKEDAEDVIKALLAQAEEMPDGVDKSLVLTLAGHAARLEELNADAIKYYQQATREWADNESASRWLRHLRRRVAEDDKKKPFSSSFLNKRFTTKSK